MIIVRDVFQAKYGKGGDLVALFKEAVQMWPQGRVYNRVLTDASGTFFTVVAEAEAESLQAWEDALGQLFADPRFGQWFERMQPLVETGRREFYRVEM